MSDDQDQDQDQDHETRSRRIEGAHRFLRTRWPEDVADGWVTLCHRPSDETHGMYVAGAYPIEDVALRELASRAVDLSPSHEVWVLLNALGGRPPRGRKGSEVGLRYLAGLHEDLDNEKVGDPLGMLADLDEEWQPSLIVASGGGHHAYWLFAEPVDLAEEAEWDGDRLNEIRGWHKALAGRWHAWLETQAHAKFDNCSNLDRVMRLPGTRNHKRAGGSESTADVRTAVADTGRRFTPAAIEELLDAKGISAPAAGGGAQLDRDETARAFSTQGTLSAEEAEAVIENIEPVHLHRANHYLNHLRSRNRELFNFAQQLNDHGVDRDRAIEAVHAMLPKIRDYNADGEYEPITPGEALIIVSSAYAYPPRGAAVNPDAPTEDSQLREWATNVGSPVSANGEQPAVKDEADEADGTDEGGGGGEAGGGGGGGAGGLGAARVVNERPSNRDTDRANGEALVAALAGYAMWVPGENWLVWDGQRWVPDDIRQRQELLQEQLVLDFIRRAVEAQQGDRDVYLKRVHRLESRSGMENAFHFAEPGLATRTEDLDRRPWLLNTPSGTLDLRDGTLRKPDPADLLTRITPVEYDPEAADPVWERSLERLVHHPEDRAWLQRWAGYSLTGLTTAKAIACLQGPPDTGKSTLSGALVNAMGSVGTGGYSANWDAAVISENGGVNREAVLASARAARLVVASELSSHARMDAAWTKSVTGGDLVRARRLYRDDFSYQPQLKLLMHTNHIPRTADVALQKRLRILRSGDALTGEERDDAVMGYLHSDPQALAAVLAWAVAGCERWQVEGLGEPVEHREELAAFARSSDPVVRFIEDCLEPAGEDPSTWARKSEVEAVYAVWAMAEGVRALGRYKLWEALAERGVRTAKLMVGGDRANYVVRMRLSEGGGQNRTINQYGLPSS